MTVIRPHAPTDKEAILTLLRLNTPAYFAPEEEQDLIEYLANHAENYFVVEEKGEILACGGFNIMGDTGVVRISWDIVHPKSQGKGLGGQLTAFRIQQIKALPGVRLIEVRTSQLVYGFYERQGFELKEVVRNYWAEGFDLYRMEQTA